jgi:hypothetical protein
MPVRHYKLPPLIWIQSELRSAKDILLWQLKMLANRYCLLDVHLPRTFSYSSSGLRMHKKSNVTLFVFLINNKH